MIHIIAKTKIDRNKKNQVAMPTRYDDPLGYLHERGGEGEEVMDRQPPGVSVRGHLEGLWDSHALVDALCVLQIIVDAVHLGLLRRG